MGDESLNMDTLPRALLISAALISVTYVSCVARMGTYPGYTGDYAPSGMVMVSGARGSTQLEVSYDLKNTQPNSAAGTQGIHIHTGTSCDENHVGGHFYATASDPWSTYAGPTDGNGDTTGKFNVWPGLSMCDVTGHVVVVHDSSNIKIGCGVCYESCTASIKAYPSTSDGKYSSVAGDVSVSTDGDVYLTGASPSRLKVGYSLTGVEPGLAPGLHIHTGTTCADADYVSGHFYSSDADPWLTLTSAADYSGATSGNFQVIPGLALSDVVGHAVVVHDASGRIGCGICERTTECRHRYDTCVTKMEKYPGYTGPLQPSGKVAVFGTPGTGYGYKSHISLQYDLAGLLSNYAAPIHIHTGTTCGDSQLVAGHYYASPADPWDTRTLATDGTGAILGTIAGVHSGISAASSVGHAIVVHDGSNRIACGVCVPTCTATMAAYPGYAGSVNLAGTVKATATGMDHFSSTIDLDYQLTGAEPSVQGGIHIHTGTTCADASLVSGHYFATASDPWSTTTYQTDGYGAVTGTIAGVAAGLGFNAIVDHTIVVHDSAGARIGCGVCRPDSVAPLPLCNSPGAPEISVCGDLKSVFQSNTCCGISAKPLNNSLFRPAQAMPSSGPSTDPPSQPSMIPSSGASTKPTSQPSAMPSSGPSAESTSQPSAMPSSSPSTEPTLITGTYSMTFGRNRFWNKLAISEDGNLVFATETENNMLGALWKSTDGGTTFSEVTALRDV